MLLLESCVETYKEAIDSQKNGASRIELCSALEEDGLTPSFDLTETLVKELNIPIMVMIRPRGGDFVYSETDVQQMIAEIKKFKTIGVHGVVFGCLTKENKIDIETTTRLAQIAMPLQVTFHKAIDYTSDIENEFPKLLTIKGITRVLSSGGKATAMEGKDVLNRMIEISGGKIKIIAAGRVTKDNIQTLSSLIYTDEFHGRKIVL